MIPDNSLYLPLSGGISLIFGDDVFAFKTHNDIYFSTIPKTDLIFF